MTNKFKIATFVAVISTLTACGGGGDGNWGTTNASAEGLWGGTSSTNYTVRFLGLENNTFYAIFGTTSTTGALSVIGVDYGAATANGNALSGTLSEYLYNGTATTGTIAGTVTTGTSIASTVTYSTGASSTIALTPLTGGYNYNTAASIANISGAWSGTTLTGVATNLTIGTTGAITGSSGGCSLSGTVTPRATGKNVFDVSLTFGAAPCALPGQTVAGIGINYTTTSNQTQFLVAVTNTANTAGTMFIGLR